MRLTTTKHVIIKLMRDLCEPASPPPPFRNEYKAKGRMHHVPYIP